MAVNAIWYLAGLDPTWLCHAVHWVKNGLEEVRVVQVLSAHYRCEPIMKRTERHRSGGHQQPRNTTVLGRIGAIWQGPAVESG